MEIINSKRHKDFVQDLREILNQTQMISYEIKNKEIKNKLSEIVIPNFIEVISKFYLIALITLKILLIQFMLVELMVKEQLQPLFFLHHDQFDILLLN